MEYIIQRKFGKIWTCYDFYDNLSDALLEYSDLCNRFEHLNWRIIIVLERNY